MNVVRLGLAGLMFVVVLGASGVAQARGDAQRVPLVQVAGDKDEPAAGTTDKVWFAFFGGDYQKPELQDRGFLIDLVGFLFFEVGGAIWAPMLLVDAPFDMEWVGPTLVYMIVAWVFSALAILFCWTGFGLLMFIPAFVAAWIGTEVALANLDRPEVKLGPAEEAPKPQAPKASPKKKK